MVVFDGYSDKLSTKVQEYARRSSSSSADIQIKSSTKVATSREAFFTNPHNKVQLIKILSERLQAIGFMTEQSKGSAVTMAEDTDVSVLLMSHWGEAMGDVVFGRDIKEKKK